MGDLTQRLLAAFVHHKIIPAEPIKDGEEFDESTPLDSIVPVNGRTDMSNLEDRIRMELKSIGLLDDDTVVRTCKSAKVQLYHPPTHPPTRSLVHLLQIDLSQREDDEICAEIRALQRSLRYVFVQEFVALWYC